VDKGLDAYFSVDKEKMLYLLSFILSI